MKNIKKLSFKNGIIYDNKTQIILKKLARSINFLFEFWSHLNFFYITQFNTIIKMLIKPFIKQQKKDPTINFPLNEISIGPFTYLSNPKKTYKKK